MQEMTNTFWTSVKKRTDCAQLVQDKVKQLNEEAAKVSDPIMRFLRAKPASTSPSQPHSSIDAIQCQPVLPVVSPPSVPTAATSSISKVTRAKPKQEEITARLFQCSSELDRLHKIRQFHLASDETYDSIDKLEKERTELKKSLKRLVDNAQHSQESRNKKRVKLEKLIELMPEAHLVKARSMAA